MAHTYERPDLPALAELEQLVRHLADELAAWRRRSLKAEAEVQEFRTRGGGVPSAELAQARQRIVDLETENHTLRLRIEAAHERLAALARRLEFLERDAVEGSAR